MKRIIFFAVLLLLGFFASAQYSVSIDEAQLKAIEFSTQNFDENFQPFEVKAIKGEISKSTYAYIVNFKPEGWAMVSADKRVVPIIGYSDKGYFDVETLPNLPFYFWFSDYEKQINEASESKDLAIHNDWLKAKSNSKFDILVEPIIQVEWNQSGGWNQFCPTDAAGPGGHVYAGCVAVAMGQAMSVYGYPRVGTGSKSYSCPPYGQLFANFGETEYKWQLTDPSSPNEHTALILYHLGVSVSMNYSASGSGAFSGDVPNAMKNYFDYSNGIKMYSKENFSNEAWAEMLMNELNNGRPVYYSGDAGDGKAGHAFNLDGADDNGRFHFNWGWSGSNNGYFYLTSLTPGGSSFTAHQSAVIGIMPRNHVPTDITLSNTSIDEGLPTSTIVGKITVSDETPGDSHTFEVRGEEDLFGEIPEVPFTTDGNNLITTQELSYIAQRKYRIVIKAIDLKGHEFEKAFLIDVNKVTTVEQHYLEQFLSYYSLGSLNYSFSDTYIGNYQVFLTDVLGRVVYTSQMLKDAPKEQKVINLETLNPGIYILSIKLPNRLVSRKFYLH